tara:strand:- start:494 stop:1108 length:615 start_codon:yes stop_codon:yes gene_type:complete
MFFLFLLLPIIKAQQPTVCGVPNFDIFTLNSGCLMAAMVNRRICAKNCANIQDAFTIYKNRFDNICKNCADCPETETAVTTFQTNAQFYIDKLNTTMTYDTTINSLQINTTCALEHDGKIIEYVNNTVISVESSPAPSPAPVGNTEFMIGLIVIGVIIVIVVVLSVIYYKQHHKVKTYRQLQPSKVKTYRQLQQLQPLQWLTKP